MSGMISIRNNGEQMPALVRRFLGGGVYKIYNVFVCFLMLLVGVVFIYTPGDLFVAQILSGDVSTLSAEVITVYGVILLYYLAATLLPIDKIIGRVYPIFGAILLLSAVGIFFGLFRLLPKTFGANGLYFAVLSDKIYPYVMKHVVSSIK